MEKTLGDAIQATFGYERLAKTLMMGDLQIDIRVRFQPSDAPQTSDPEWVSRSEAAEIAGCSLRTLERRIADKKIRTKKISVSGRTERRCFRADVEALE